MIKKPGLIETYHCLHGGNGKVLVERNITREDGIQGLDMLARVSVEVGASIGYHQHVEDSEGYFIVEGEGVFIDNGKVEKEVVKGDFCFICKGQGHGIINTGDVPLEIMAIVIS
ncbi:cupin domain-containing protein [Sporosarcina pasteurii]|uniref:Uncharacterized conserved protein, contains double-stranded beta-helix domain n=1 Tax=Sporosarcina pasteurii TaxID=1474 RepID=A0A380C1K7_SPOPA|nr:cupin domain-containing protein [Sporosarcina pasteurii]MDS9471506.1 cupin domain-containing protein [Sporosarcina pasteurii]QBQ04874.1 cupin domain-containing protein [Sporosarcina pasteurii]SUJ10601.1 Uncharacterized conserved protein, contains double-stranded beta-helix domain [Sporosarcina pasteurii]